MTEKIYDVFLSHNNGDKAAVEELARRLADEAELNPFLDKWHLVPGEPWQEAIEAALDQSRTCAVFIGPRGLGPWEHEEMRAAIEQRVTDRAFRVIPILLPGAERGERGRLPTFLSRATWVEFRQSLDDAEAFRRFVAGIKGQAPGRGPGEVVYQDICPYRGLQVFEEEHAPFFFGREAATEWLVDELRNSRFLSVIGPSGSGKSSLVRAGLVPALRRGDLPDSHNWPLRIFTPGPRPLESLAVTLTNLVSPNEDPTAPLRLMDALAADRRQLHLTTRLNLAKAPIDGNVMLVVDQFEEIFTLCQEEEQREPFIDNLLYASAIEDGQTMVILTMRADFYGKCALYPDLAARITDHQMLVTPMTEEELRQAIERPAQLVGLEFEGGLIETLLHDVQAEPGALPLLQQALLELWERREGRRLTFAAYHTIGGIQGAIAHRAESIYEGFDDTKREMTRRVMLRLTQPGEGKEDTRRRATLAELLPAEGETTSLEEVLRKLTDARLLTAGKDERSNVVVDVAHEALIRSWPQLQEWIAQDRAGLLIHHRLTEAAAEWQRHNRDKSYLLTGTRLNIIKEWAATHFDLLTSEREFFFHSIVEENIDVQEWLPRFGTLEEAMSLANEYLGSGQISDRIKGLSVLRWISNPGNERNINMRLRDIILNDPANEVSKRAVEVLCERGQTEWLMEQLDTYEKTERLNWIQRLWYAVAPVGWVSLKLPEKWRLIHAIGHARNLPNCSHKITSTLKGVEKNYILLSAASQLVWDYRMEFAVVLAFSYGAAQFGQIVSSIFRGSLPYNLLTLLLMVFFGLYMLLRLEIDGEPMTVKTYYKIGFLAVLIGEGIFTAVIRTFAVMSAALFPFEYQEYFEDQGLELLFFLLFPFFNFLAQMFAMSIMARSFSVSPKKEKRKRKLLWYAALGTTIPILVSELPIAVFLIYFSLDYFGSTIATFDLLPQLALGLPQLAPGNWLEGVAVAYFCFIGYQWALQFTFKDKFFRQNSGLESKRYITEATDNV